MFAKTVKFIIFGFVGIIAVGGVVSFMPSDGYLAWNSSENTLVRNLRNWNRLEDPKYVSASARSVFLVKDKKAFTEAAKSYIDNKIAVIEQFDALKEALDKGQPLPNVDIPDRLVGKELSKALEVAITKLFSTPGLMINPNGYLIGYDEALQKQSSNAEKAYLEANEKAFRDMLIESDQIEITASEKNFILSGIEAGYKGVFMHVQADLTDSKKLPLYKGNEESAPFYYQTLFMAYRDLDAGSEKLTVTPIASEQFPEGMPYYVDEPEDSLFRDYSRVIANL